MAGGFRGLPDRDDVLRRAYALSTQDQYLVLAALRDYLGAELSAELPQDVALREREQALAALRRVADHLKLPAGRSPTAAQYRAAPENVTQGLSATHIARAWGRFRFAQNALQGKRVPESAVQRSVRRATSGRDSGYETHLEALRIWWATTPVSTTTRDYEAFAAERNRDIARGTATGKLLPGLVSVTNALGLPWKSLLRMLTGSKTYEQLVAAKKEELEQRDVGELKVIGAGQIGLLLDLSTQRVLQMRRDRAIPTHVITAGQQYGWALADIVAYRDGKPYPRRQPGELQHLVMDSNELAEALGIGVDSLRAARHNGRPTVPPEDGRIGSSLYWLREHVERWMQEHGREEGRARRPNKRANRPSR